MIASRTIGVLGSTFVAVVLALAVGRMAYGCGSRSRDSQVEELATRLAQSERTVEVKEGLYATKLVEAKDLGSLLDKNRLEGKELSDQLERSKSKLLATQQLAMKWKSSYEGSLKAQQVDSGPSPISPGTTRKRVDFQRDFGSIEVTGHTLSDPPEAEVSVRQSRPLLLTVGVSRDRDGKWASLVTSSDPNVEVAVNLGGVDPGVIPSPSWYQRIWIDLGAAAIGDPSATLGLSYRGDRFALGASCFESPSAHGCGLVGGIRLFR